MHQPNGNGIRIVSYAWGIRVGSFSDVYEVPIDANREKVVDCLTKSFRELGCVETGRAYDGSFIFKFSSRREVTVHFAPGELRFVDRFRGALWLRFRPSWLRKKIPWIIHTLTVKSDSPPAQPKVGP